MHLLLDEQDQWDHGEAGNLAHILEPVDIEAALDEREVELAPVNTLEHLERALGHNCRGTQVCGGHLSVQRHQLEYGQPFGIPV